MVAIESMQTDGGTMGDAGRREHHERQERRPVEPPDPDGPAHAIIGHRRPAARRARHRGAFAVAAALILVVALVVTGFVILRPDSAGNAAVVAGPWPDESPTAAPTTPITASLSPSADPTATPTPTTTTKPAATKKPKPRPTAKPPADELPPPPEAPPPAEECPTFQGAAADPAEVRTALSTAGARDYWARAGVTAPMGVSGPVGLPTIALPATLMNAVAWAESSWRSNVIACDGGIGTMQIMPGTADFVNMRFNADYDVDTLAGNTSIGAAYLEWLTVYFGIFYFGESFDLDATAPVGDGGETMVLRDVVIAAYNVGHRAVENEQGTDDPADDTLSIPNQWYVDRVNGYVADCPCDDL